MEVDEVDALIVEHVVVDARAVDAPETETLVIETFSLVPSTLRGGGDSHEIHDHGDRSCQEGSTGACAVLHNEPFFFLNFFVIIF